MEELEAKIEIIQNKLRLKEMIKKRFHFLDEELKLLNQKHNRQLAIVYKEYEDIEQLEEKSTSFLFSNFLKDKDKQLEKERQEYLMAVLMLRHIKDEIDVLEYEKNVLKNKYENISPEEEDLQELLALKEEKLKLMGDPSSNIISIFNRKIETETQRINHIEDAIICCENTIKEMNSILYNLKKVSHWGHFTAGGAGVASSFEKRKYIDNNRLIIPKINLLLKNLQNELENIYPDRKLNITIQDFQNFVEIFYDHLITDWILQRKMVNAIQNISQNIDKLKTTILMLSSEKEKSDTRIYKLKDEKQLYLLNL
jgi:hypothetical protein